MPRPDALAHLPASPHPALLVYGMSPFLKLRATFVSLLAQCLLPPLDHESHHDNRNLVHCSSYL